MLKEINYDYGDSENPKLKFRNMPVKGFGIPPINKSILGLPSVDTGTIQKLRDGLLMKFFKKNN